MRSPLPSPPTLPDSTSWPPFWRSTYTDDSDRLPGLAHGRAVVVATRRFPSHSDIEYWFSSQPSTSPAAANRGVLVPLMSNLYSWVFGWTLGTARIGPSTSGPRIGMTRQRWSLATYRLGPLA